MKTTTSTRPLIDWFPPPTKTHLVLNRANKTQNFDWKSCAKYAHSISSNRCLRPKSLLQTSNFTIKKLPSFIVQLHVCTCSKFYMIDFGVLNTPSSSLFNYDINKSLTNCVQMLKILYQILFVDRYRRIKFPLYQFLL